MEKAAVKPMMVRVMSSMKVRATAIGGSLLLCLGAAQLLAQSPHAANAPLPSFDVAAIKPDPSSGNSEHVSFNNNTFVATGVTAKRLIEFAYEVRDFQISGGPGWAGSEKYAINAKIDEDTLEALKKSPKQGSDWGQLMLQSLLAERFNLKISRSNKELPIYALVVAKNGPKLSQAANPSGPSGSSSHKRGEVTYTGMPMSGFADRLSREVGRKVVDKTGLQGKYDFTLHWTQERLTSMVGSAANSSQAPAPLPDSSGPSIFTALQEQLGLKLEPQKGPVEILVIESIDKPTDN